MAKATKDDLNDKQRLFCQEYLIDLNATQSAIRAGYSPKTARDIGCENLTKPNIQEYIQELMKVRSEKLNISAEWVLQRFYDISNRCMTAEPVMIKNEDGEWVPSGEYQFDSSGANKATEQIAKHIGFFSEDNKQKAIPVKQIFKIGDCEIEL